MPQSLANTYLHLIFSTKDRRPLIPDHLKAELHSYMATTLANLKSPALQINSMPDHVHILFNLSRTIALSIAVEDVKKGSSKWIKTKGVIPFSWQAGYASFSVRQSNLKAVRGYIINQEKHHQERDHIEELRAFLIKHEYDFDEQYL